MIRAGSSSSADIDLSEPSQHVADIELVGESPAGSRPPSVTGRRVAGNVVWNVLGQGVPILVAFACLPVLSRSLGTDRFGLLVLSWTFVGYFSIFDLGLAVAMERSVARHLAVGNYQDVGVTVWTTLATMFALGIAALMAAWLAAPAIISALRMSTALQSEALLTMHLLALSIPLVIISVGLRGVLAAHMKFRVINAVGVPLGMWTYLGPILALPFSHSLVLIVALLLAGRIAGFGLYLGYCVSTVPSLRSLAFRRALVRPLMTFGGWLALDDLMDPIISFLDRFLVGSLISVASVAYYGVPYQLAAQGWILASALSAVLFPLLSGVLENSDDQARVIFRRAVTGLVLGMFPITLVIVGFARPGLQLWVGSEYAARSTLVLQIIAVGVLVTSVGSIGGTFNGSAGRPDVNAKLGMLKFALHVAPVWWVISNFGIAGLAALWMACASAEAVGMVLYALRAQGFGMGRILRRASRFLLILALLAVAALDLPLGWKVTYVIAVMSGAGVVAWRSVMTPMQRRLVRMRLGIKPISEALSER